MSVYAISDLHLSFQTQKPMDKFGGIWGNYEEKLKANWNLVVSEDDIVLISGDVSWATYLNEAVEDFRFINDLNGQKLISKGNHDYWWETVTKLNNFLLTNEFKTIKFVHNNTIVYENYAICGAKGYDFSIEERLRSRELQRLELSLSEGEKTGKEKIVMLHYPPFSKDGSILKEFSDLFEKYKVTDCVYGHLHGKRHSIAVNDNIKGVNYKLSSCDFINFMPIFVR